MLSNITSNTQKHSRDRKSLLNSGDKVYLYGDISYTGTLIRPVERAYPPKWTVRVDHRGYEAVNVQYISLIESQGSNLPDSDRDSSFGDAPEPSYEQLQREIIALKRKNARLKEENELVKKDLDSAKQIIRRAKDISPLMRISLKRVLRLAHDACMDVKRTVGGWVLKMGSKARKFRRLADIWYLLSQDEFLLSDIFPEDKLIAVENILPPRPRKRPTPSEKRTFPLMHHGHIKQANQVRSSCPPEDVIRNRSMSLVR